MAQRRPAIVIAPHNHQPFSQTPLMYVRMLPLGPKCRVPSFQIAEMRRLPERGDAVPIFAGVHFIFPDPCVHPPFSTSPSTYDSSTTITTSTSNPRIT